MDKIKIIVIDTGVDNSHRLFCNNPIRGLNIVDSHDEKNSYDISDQIGHGTAICGIIRRHSPNADIRMYKIYQDQMTSADPSKLIEALEHILLYDECDIINMSLGVLFDSSRLHGVCRQLKRKGCILVASFDNTGAVSFPAAYKEVLGVDTSYKCILPEDYIYVKNGMVNLYGKSGNTRVAWTDGKDIIGRGASYATAFITANIANILAEAKSKNYSFLEKYLQKNSIDTYHYNKIKNSCDNDRKIKQIKKAALFPLNKEIQCLMNFPELLSFEIKRVYDTKQHGYIGSKWISLDGKSQYVINDGSEIDFDEIDTLIIGHTSEISRLSKRNFKRLLLESCLEHRKNVYCFENSLIEQYIERYNEAGLFLVCPGVPQHYNKAGKLFSIESPVLGVYGTSGEQGKFTLQLQLRKAFIERGYRIGQLGTEPSALLFGMDDVLPFGYEGTIRLQNRDFIETINSMLHNIDINNPDIIITGGQSNLIPRFLYNVEQACLPQLNFLLGSNPDIVVLCVNLYDEIEYIQRCLYTLKGLLECKVVALAIFPLYYPNEWHVFSNKKVTATKEQIDNYKLNLNRVFDIPSFIIGSEEIDALVNKCIESLL